VRCPEKEIRVRGRPCPKNSGLKCCKGSSVDSKTSPRRRESLHKGSICNTLKTNWRTSHVTFSCCFAPKKYQRVTAQMRT